MPPSRRRPTASQVLGRIVLVTGKEEYLSERTVQSVREAVRAHDTQAEVADTPARDLTLATLGEMAAPSLFSSTRCVIVRGLEDLPDESHDGLVDYARAPADDVALVLVHGGGQRGTGLLGKLRKLTDTVTEVKSEEIKPRELPAFVVSEVAGHGGRIDDDAASFLIQAVGHDLRSLAAAADQLASDFPGAVTLDQVKRYFGGRAEAKSFAVADAAFAGRRADALEELRWALDGGTAPVLVTSAFAGNARAIARFLGTRGGRDHDLARDIGVPPWKVRMVRDQARAFSAEAISKVVRAVAHADADIKGQAHDAAYTLERLVLAVAAHRDG
jgi:DNA polymerase III subunit delta